MPNEEMAKLDASVRDIEKALGDLYNYIDISMPSGGESLRLLWDALRICTGILAILKSLNFQSTDAYQSLAGWKKHLKQKTLFTYRIYFHQQGFSETQIQTLMKKREEELDSL